MNGGDGQIEQPPSNGWMRQRLSQDEDIPAKATGQRGSSLLQTGRTLLGPDLGDVCHPCSVRRIDIELLGKRVVDYHRRPAAIVAGPMLVADLRTDPMMASSPQ